jgi:hypothetical protein
MKSHLLPLKVGAMFVQNRFAISNVQPLVDLQFFFNYAVVELILFFLVDVYIFRDVCSLKWKALNYL